MILMHNPQATDSLVMLDMHTFKLIWLFFSCADKKKKKLYFVLHGATGKCVKKLIRAEGKRHLMVVH